MEWSTTHELVRFKLFKKPARLVFDLFYYPGWRAYLMRKDEVGYSIVEELEIEPWGKLGKISVVLSERRHVLIRFEDTPVRVAGKYLSLASLILVVLSLGGRSWWRRRYGAVM